MSGKKADKQRYWLTFLLNDLPVGGNFKPDALHLTIIPWFVTQWSEKDIIDSFYKDFTGVSAFELTVGRIEEFRQKRRILINHLEPREEVTALHQKALAWFSDIEARWALEYPRVDEEFIPHIRRREGKNVEAGEKLYVSSLSLVKARRRGDDYREVAAKVNFDEKT